MKRSTMLDAALAMTSVLAQNAPSPVGAPPPGGAPAGGPPPPPARGPSLPVALELAQTALAACAADKLNVTAVVVDSGGFVKVSLMSDGARSMTPAFGVRKAALALAFKQPSSEVAKLAHADAALKARIDAEPKYFVTAGAVLLKAGDDIIGALAVSGARSDQDEACALKAVDLLKGKLQ